MYDMLSTVLRYSALSAWIGVLFSDGQRWTEQRRFVLQTLRDFGFGKMAIEDTIRDELRDMVSHFEGESARGAINPQIQLMRSVGNIICALVFGQRMGGVDKDFDRIAYALTNDVVATTDIRFFILSKYEPRSP